MSRLRLKTRNDAQWMTVERLTCFIASLLYAVMMILFAVEAYYLHQAFKRDDWAFREEANGTIYLLALTIICSFSFTICGAIGTIKIQEKFRLYIMLAFHPIIAIFISALVIFHSNLPDKIHATAPWQAAIPSIVLAIICLLIILFQAKLRSAKRRNVS